MVNGSVSGTRLLKLELVEADGCASTRQLLSKTVLFPPKITESQQYPDNASVNSLLDDKSRRKVRIKADIVLVSTF